MSISDSMEKIAKKSAKKNELEDSIMSGIILGTVLEIGTKENQGKIKVEIIVRGKNNAYWMPVVTGYGGKGWGTFVMPEVSDTVAVAFIDGNMANPVAIGCFYNKDAKLPQERSTPENFNKVLKTKGGNEVAVNDKQNEQYINMITPAGHSLKLDDGSQKESTKNISLSDKKGENRIQFCTKKGELEINAAKKITIKVGKITFIFNGDSGEVSVQCEILTTKAKQKTKQETAGLEIKSNTIGIKASGILNIESGGTASVKGKLLKLN